MVFDRCDRWMAILGGFIVASCLVLWLPGSAEAYFTYSQNRDATNCRACHLDFRDAPYDSFGDGGEWTMGLHETHQFMVNDDCETCHSPGPRFPVLLGSSEGGVELDAISCAGCHGRAQDGTGVDSEGYGAGLRQHHWRNGVMVCGDVGCHTDADPAAFTPIGEWAFPPYYSTADAAHPDIPSDPCNLSPGFGENYASTSLGLDNDGNNLYDANDMTACPEPGAASLLSSGLAFLMLLGRRRLR